MTVEDKKVKVNKSKPPIPDFSTQRYLPFSQIRDNVMIMKDGSVRVVLKCTTINFLLKGEQEQDAIIMSYQRFLNSLDFPVQIMIRSTKLDIDGYLNKLSTVAVKQKNPLLQNQTYDYIEYLKKLIEVAQIMKKDFYIVVPFDYEENKSVRDITVVGMFTNFWKGINKSDDIGKIKEQIRSFKKMQKGLIGRVNSVRTSLESIGIKAMDMSKTDTVKLLADYYNPNMDNITAIKGELEDYNIT